MDAIHIVGAGGIGCAVGYALLQAKRSVVFVESSDAKLADGRANGVRVDSLPPLRAEFVAFRDWSPPPKGVTLLCVKCPANATVLGRLPPTASLIPIQNGFDPALIERGTFAEGIASFVSECLPGRTHTRITRRGDLHLSAEASDLAASLGQAPFRVRVVADVLPHKYTKLMYNAAISPLAASAGLDNGELLRWKKLRGLFFALLRENHAILRHAGVPLGQVGPLRPATVAGILRRPWLAHALAWAFYPSLRGTYCSMAPDLPHGPTEIDNYNGHLIALAGEFPCPLNRAVHALVKGIEAGRLTPRPELLGPLWRVEAGAESCPAAAAETTVGG
ncbi:MAG: ketopantoate reductase C-terminal domain-containing protein [Gemmataceae bacterium]